MQIEFILKESENSENEEAKWFEVVFLPRIGEELTIDTIGYKVVKIAHSLSVKPDNNTISITAIRLEAD